MIDWQIMDKVREDKKKNPDDYIDQYQHDYYLRVLKERRRKEK